MDSKVALTSVSVRYCGKRRKERRREREGERRKDRERRTEREGKEKTEGISLVKSIIEQNDSQYL